MRSNEVRVHSELQNSEALLQVVFPDRRIPIGKPLEDNYWRKSTADLPNGDGLEGRPATLAALSRITVGHSIVGSRPRHVLRFSG